MSISAGKILHSAFRERVLPELEKTGFIPFPGEPIWFGEYSSSGRSYLYDLVYKVVHPAFISIRCVISSEGKYIGIQASISPAKEEYPDLAAIGDNRLNDDDLIYYPSGHISHPYQAFLDGGTWSRYKIINVDGFTMRKKKGSKEQLEASANEVVDLVLERLPYLWGFLFKNKSSKYISMNNELRLYLKDNQPFWVTQ